MVIRKPVASMITVVLLTPIGAPLLGREPEEEAHTHFEQAEPLMAVGRAAFEIYSSGAAMTTTSAFLPFRIAARTEPSIRLLSDESGSSSSGMLTLV